MAQTRRPAPHRKFIALILCLSLAITGFSAAPARADNDVAKVLAGLAALAIIGAAINEAQDDNRRRDHVTRQPVYTPPPPPRTRPLPPRIARYDLPGSCLRDFRGYNGRKLLGKRCLENNYRHAASLPQSCQVTFWNGRKYRTAYKPRCLNKNGYRITSR